MTAESPTPDLPRGAGGPQARAAGRGTGTALVLDSDPLARLLVAPAVLDLGFAGVAFGSANDERLGDGEQPAAVFVALDGPSDCRNARRAAAHAGLSAPLLAGYGRGPTALLGAHRAHGCCDLVLRLGAAAGRPRLEHLAAGDAVAAAGLSVREADVLVFLLQGLTTSAIAAKLCIAGSTARSHCRAVLRKLGAPDRRVLRAVLLDQPLHQLPDAPCRPEHALPHRPSRSSTAPRPGLSTAEPQICRASLASFGEKSAVATRRAALHT